MGGGSGMVPLMAMLRHRGAAIAAEAHARHKTPARVLYSSASLGLCRPLHREELARLAEDDETLEVALGVAQRAPAACRDCTGFRPAHRLPDAGGDRLYRRASGRHVFVVRPYTAGESAAPPSSSSDTIRYR